MTGTVYLIYFHASKHNLQDLTLNVPDLKLRKARDCVHLPGKDIHLLIQENLHVQQPAQLQHSGVMWLKQSYILYIITFSAHRKSTIALKHNLILIERMSDWTKTRTIWNLKGPPLQKHIWNATTCFGFFHEAYIIVTEVSFMFKT